MTPLPDDGKFDHVVSNVALVGEKEFMQTLKERDTPFFAIVTRHKKEVLMKPKDKVKGEQKWKDVGPKEVKNLLEKYHGIVLDSIPTSLPPKR